MMHPKSDEESFSLVNEPFGQGRNSFRLIFDFGSMLSCFELNTGNHRVLDFCAGTGWLSEWLNRIGFDVFAIDINEHSGNIIQRRFDNDLRLNPDKMHFRQTDGHELPFENEFFGHICSFDSLHHMRDYPKVIAEMFRVLCPGGRAVFIEPGSKHSTSKETIEFIQKYKTDDPTWIERDVVLDEIFKIALSCGFSSLIVRPLLLPNLREYDFHSWKRFQKGDQRIGAEYLSFLKSFNYESHLVFYLEKSITKNVDLPPVFAGWHGQKQVGSDWWQWARKKLKRSRFNSWLERSVRKWMSILLIFSILD